MEQEANLDGEMLDSVTQSLFSLTLTLRAARRNVSENNEEAERLLDSAEDLAQRALSEMCALTFEVRPHVREQVGLASALQTHTRSLQARSGLTIHLSIKGDRRLRPDLEEALYQIVRVALRDVVVYARATEASVELDLEGETVYISIRDNSRESDSSIQRAAAIRAKVEALGGAIEVKRHEESGSELLAWVPAP
jgi:signal transduction histidine kinase